MKCHKCGNEIPQGKEIMTVDVGWGIEYPLCELCDERMELSYPLW